MFPQLVLSESVPEHMFWYMLPAPALIGRQSRRPSFTTDERLEKKKILDEKESEWSCHAPLSLDAENIGGTFLKYYWINYVRNELAWGVRATTNIWILLCRCSYGENWRMGKEEGI